MMEKKSNSPKAAAGNETAESDLFISIVVPVYNVISYIDRFMQSVLAQTYKNFELILVDDGSTDGCAEKCEDYARRDKRITVIHQANRGAGAARNAGLKSVTGEAVIFFDADDKVEPDLLRDLLNLLCMHNAELVWCGYREIHDNEIIERHPAAGPKSGEEILKSLYDKTCGMVVWNKMFRREVLLDSKDIDITFPEDVTNSEDFLWLVKVLMHCERAYCTDKILYNYYRRTNSATGNLSARLDKNALSNLTARERVAEICAGCSEDSAYLANRVYFYSLYSTLKLADSRGALHISEMICEKLKSFLKVFQPHTIKEHFDKQRIRLILALKKIHAEEKIICFLEQPKTKIKNAISLEKTRQKNEEKSVTIVTIYDPLPNFGNRLQNYAVQHVMSSLNLCVKTIRFETNFSVWKNRQWKQWSWKGKLKFLLKKVLRYHIPDRETQKLNQQRKTVFNHFNKTYIHTEYIKKIKKIKHTDFFVLGSDQVWNTAWWYEGDLKKDLFLLTFAPPEKKVCFSPSFGTSEIPDEWTPWFRRHLTTFPRLGVREEAGAALIKELTGREAQVTLDPTLMLDASDWRQLAAKPKKIDCSGKYILTYFLGGRSERVNADLKRFSKEIGAQVYNLLDTSQPELYKADPAEFVYLIDHAQLVLTDSFHACVFSFLLGKPFLVYNREGKENNMMSRMDTLLGTFDLKRKYADSGLENDLLECDYSNGYKTLEVERKKTLQFLKESMNLGNDADTDSAADADNADKTITGGGSIN